MKTRSPIPYIIVIAIILIIGIVAYIATGGQGFSAHWEWEF